MMTGEKRQIGARIPEGLYHRLRVLAARQDKRIGELVEEAIVDLLRKHTGKSAGRRT